MGGAYEREIERWRAHRVARLRGPDGWLTLIGLWWLEEGANEVGSDPSSRVMLPPPAPARLGTIQVAGARAVLTVRSGAVVTHEGEPVTELELRDDAEGPPTIVRLGNLSFHLIHRDGRRAVRVRDAESPAREAFGEIESFPVDRRWRMRARFEPYDPPRVLPVPTVLGRDETYRVPGTVAFDLGGTSYRLDVFLETGETDLFIVFGDRTNGFETFGGGRYLYTRPPRADGAVSVDFNKAYNPPCVFTAFATCALPLPQNRLPVRIEAGEKRYGDKG